MSEAQPLPDRIDSHAALLDGARALAARHSDLASALAMVDERLGPLPDRSRAPGFASLLYLIVGQQVSLASASAIWARIEGAMDPISPEALLALPPEVFERLGLSKPKKRYALALAEAIVAKWFCPHALKSLSADEARSALLSLLGIGPWTAETYLLFCHGEADAWPGGDVALQVAVQHLLRLPGRPDTAQMEELGDTWRPGRGIAAHILWAYYKTL